MASHRTVAEWEAQIGSQVRELRLRRNMPQERLAQLADVSVSTIHALETGAGSSLRTLVKVVRALERTDWLAALAPLEVPSPIAMLRGEGARRGRQRASRSTAHGV